MQTQREKIGIFAEQLAQRYLKERGFKILTTNYKKPWGEVDIIVQKQGTIHFVEVKANSKDFSFGFNPELRVNKEKLRHIVRTAESFLFEKRLDGQEWQIDILALSFDLEGKTALIKYFKKINFD